MKVFKRITCLDKASVSIQANQSAYCTPRNDVGPYTEIEAGFPSVEPPISWHPYAEDRNLTDTVYGYMPSHLVWEFIDAHGGMIDGELPPMVKQLVFQPRQEWVRDE